MLALVLPLVFVLVLLCRSAIFGPVIVLAFAFLCLEGLLGHVLEMNSRGDHCMVDHLRDRLGSLHVDILAHIFRKPCAELLLLLGEVNPSVDGCLEM